jgi:hypothetical protein
MDPGLRRDGDIDGPKTWRSLPLPEREGAPPPDQFVYFGAVQLPHTHG